MHRANICPSFLIVLVIMNITNAAAPPSSPASAAASAIGAEHEQQIDRAVAAGIELEMTPGAVIVAGRADGIVFQKAYGRMTYDSDAAQMTIDTIFDLASLSKTIGC